MKCPVLAKQTSRARYGSVCFCSLNSEVNFVTTWKHNNLEHNNIIVRSKVTKAKAQLQNSITHTNKQTVLNIFHSRNNSSQKQLTQHIVRSTGSGQLLAVWGERLFFSPALELALFFGTTSAKTDDVQVGFS